MSDHSGISNEELARLLDIEAGRSDTNFVAANKMREAARRLRARGDVQGGELALRDKMAAACLPAIYEHQAKLTDIAAQLAYEQADEMLKARRDNSPSQPKP